MVGGISDTLFPRSSHTSPLDKSSPLYRRDDIKALKDATVDGKSICLTLVDLPIISAVGISDGNLLFCGIVEDTAEILSLIVYKQIQMSKNGPGVYMSMQSTELFVNITNRRKNTHSFNGNSFLFIQQQDKVVRMSNRFTIRSWKQFQRNGIPHRNDNAVSKETLIHNINSILATRLEDDAFLKDVYVYLQKRSRNTSIQICEPDNVNAFLVDD